MIIISHINRFIFINPNFKKKGVNRMKLSKKILVPGLFFILILNSFVLLSFTNVEKDYINNALTLIEKEKYNEAVKELEEALAIIRSKADLELTNLFLCKEDPPMFGIYNPRENSMFSQEDTLFIYGEPKNYTYQEVQKGLYEIHFKVEIYLLDSSNNILAGDMNFIDFPLTSRTKNSEIFITSNIPVKDLSLSPGNYKFRFILKDILSKKSTEAILEFTIID